MASPASRAGGMSIAANGTPTSSPRPAWLAKSLTISKEGGRNSSMRPSSSVGNSA